MQNIDTSRLGRLIVAGAIAGLVTFLIINPTYVREERLEEEIHEQIQHDTAAGVSLREANERAEARLEELAKTRDPYIAGLLLDATFAALAGGFLLLFEELGSPWKRMGLKMLIAAGIGVALGGLSGVVAQFIYAVLSPGTVQAAFNLPAQIFARAVGWGIAGTGAGAAVGLALGSWRRVGICALGGFAGGLVGGLLFDGMSFATQSGSASRFIGFVLMGAAIGAAIVFAEDIAKRSWVTVLSGPKEGRSFILSKPITTIGRDELADIPLFGDTSIAKQHACLRMDGPTVTLQGTGAGALGVNGAPTQSAVLKDSDVVSVGPISMRFHQKSTQQIAAWSAGAAQPPSPYTPQSSPYATPNDQPQPTIQGPAQAQAPPPYGGAATGRLALSVTGGPHLGSRFQFDGGTVKIGRETDCGILLAQDTMVSRNHAQIAWNGSNWSISDLGSTNGVYVNGARVAQQSLNVGDVVGVGQTMMRVDAT